MIKIDDIILDWNPRVIPIPAGKKGPVTPRWTETTLRAKNLDGNFLGGETAYGIVLDEDHLVIDVDVHDADKNGWAALEKLSQDTGFDFLEECAFRVDSPSGGAHLFFSKDPEVELPKSVKEYAGLDFLTKGCQVIGAGSEHVSGGHYVINDDGGWAVEACKVPSSLSKALRPAPLPPAEISFKAPQRGGESPIDAFNRSVDGVHFLCSCLQQGGYTVLPRGDGTFDFVRPNKTSAHAISGTVGRVNTHGNRYLKNFSTADETFPVDKAVNIAEAVRLIFRFTHEELPKQLRSKGFGDPLEHDDEDLSGIEIDFASSSKQEAEAEIVATTRPCLSEEDLELRSGGGERREEIIKGLLRRGETMNIIAAPKTGKSWFVYNAAISMVSGKTFCGFSCPKKDLKCLIIDNELHAEELLYRIKAVRRGLEVERNESLKFANLRGMNMDIEKLDDYLRECGAEEFDVIFLDALYRFLPEGTSENDNAQMTKLYNQIDHLARTYDCSFVVVHHTAKGAANNSKRSVTDLGSGAGSISRAADSQITLLPHKKENYMVLEGITRSFSSPKPRTVRNYFDAGATELTCRFEHITSVSAERWTEAVERNAKKEDLSGVEVSLHPKPEPIEHGGILYVVSKQSRNNIHNRRIGFESLADAWSDGKIGIGDVIDSKKEKGTYSVGEKALLGILERISEDGGGEMDGKLFTVGKGFPIACKNGASHPMTYLELSSALEYNEEGQE